MAADFRLLGPLEASVEGVPIELPAAKPRGLLALLLLSPSRPVPQDLLVEQLWAGRPPDRATKALQVYISQLRKALGPERIETRGGGYVLVLGDDELDAALFERLLAEGRELAGAGNAALAAERLEQALALWRGEALADFRYDDWAREPAAQLEELRLEADEVRAECLLTLGRHAQAAPALQRLVELHPHRERLLGLLMLAQYRSGRQADALAAYRRGRDALAEGLGIEPGRELQDLHRRILNQDPALDVLLPELHAVPARRRRLALAAALLVTAAGAAAALAVVLATSGGHAEPQLEPYVVKVENFLAQSSQARAEIVASITGAARCTLAPARALASLERVQRNRQSLLQQLAAADVPSAGAAIRSFDLLQQAAAASIAADWRYRDWLRGRTGCAHAPPHGALAADALATRRKRAFVAVFDPLARRFGKREWRDDEF